LIKKATIIMKKAKVMLTAITVLAVVGGALAFKSKNVFHTWYYENPQNHNFCELSDVTFESKTEPGAINKATYSTNKNAIARCAGLRLVADPE